jgi:hypothetical protein
MPPAAFANAVAFSDPNSRMEATGVDLNASNAIVDPRGKVLAYAQTGGMLAPQRYEVRSGAKLYRFVGPGQSPHQAARGRWCAEPDQRGERLLS